jgi:hypothetical protein
MSLRSSLGLVLAAAVLAPTESARAEECAQAVRRALGTAVGDAAFNPAADLNSDGFVNSIDAAICSGVPEGDGGIAGGGEAVLQFDGSDLYPAAGDSFRLKLSVADCAVPLFGYSAAVRILPLAGATGTVSASAPLTNFFPPRNVILAAPSGPALDPTFSLIVPLPQGGVFVNANTSDGSTVLPVAPLNDVLGDAGFIVSPDARGIFLIQFGSSSALAAAGGQSVPFQTNFAQVSVGPRLTVSATSTATSVAPGGELIVRLSASEPLTTLGRARFAVHFDATRLRLDAASPVPGGALSVETAESIDNASGTLLYEVASASQTTGLQAAGQIAELRFTVISSDTECEVGGLVSFAPIGAESTRFTTLANTSVIPLAAELGSVAIDGTPPQLLGVPARLSRPADAGTLAGGTVDAPSVTASDSCDGDVAQGITLVFPDGSSGTSWPRVFPSGATTVVFTATDDAGNTASATCTVTVESHQLLDAVIEYGGVFEGSAPRTLRVRTGGATQLVNVQMSNGYAFATGIQVPVAAGYPCVTAKDTRFALTSSSALSVAQYRYSANFSMQQGDADDDDLVDIIDFGLFVVDRGFALEPDARSNYNADSIVNNADFSFVSLNFFRIGSDCGGGVQRPAPRYRVSVKELRRSGYGHLAVADLNRDGWVDIRDMQRYVQIEGPALSLE